MAAKHGNRIYIQVLLEPNRGKLLLEEARVQGIKPSEFVRLLVYKWLKSHVPEEEKIASELDQLVWEDAVQARLEGRAREFKKRCEKKKAEELRASDHSEQAD